MNAGSLFVVLALAVWAWGCSTSTLRSEELPESPIAVIFWTTEEARKLSEIEAGPQPSGPTREGVANVASLGRLLGDQADRHRAAELARLPGRLSFVDPRTGEVSRVEAAPKGSRPVAWSSDRRRLLFSNDRGSGYPQLFEYDLDSGNVRRVTRGSRNHSEGTFGPDGRFAWFAWRKSSGSYSAAVYATEPGGGSPRSLFEGEVVEDLAWAPDGTTLVYTRLSGKQRRTGEPDRHVVARLLPDASSEIVSEGRALARGRGSTLTPDGEWIVFSSPLQGGGWKLRRMRIDGSSKASIGSNWQRDENEPAVSPDGSFVVYIGDDGGFDRLYVRRFDGTGDRLLLTEGSAASPVW